MLKTAIVGATGVVGQQFVIALQGHPWFEISCLAASERSAGKTYNEALQDEKTGALRWFCEERPEQSVLEMRVENAAEIKPASFDLIFTAIEAEQALELEPKFAKETPVISTAASFRYAPDVPILVPGVNPEHAKLIEIQRKKRNWKGFIAPIPNCTATGLVVSLKPIYDNFGLNMVLMTSMQAVSGAGRSPGVLAFDIIDNVIPFIPKEEEKVQNEARKILGDYEKGKVINAGFKVSCTCTRVNVKDGHTESVFVSTKKHCDVEDVKNAMKKFSPILRKSDLPSAPKEMIVVLDDPFRPQPKLDRNTHGGMATVVGRIRKDDALGNGIKYVLVSHNTKMGAAKGAVLVAESLVKANYIQGGGN